MSEMVERVAKAIATSMYPNWGNDYYKDDVRKFGWIVDEDFIGMAQVAIEAMREPTPAMLEAGPLEPYMDKEVWARMIDAALGKVQ